MEVFYQSSRCFWQHRITVDIVLVEHADFGILELITHEVKVNMEAPRAYFKLALLKSAIRPSELEKRVNAMREHLLRRRECVDEQLLLETATKNAVIELLLGQLGISEYTVEAQIFLVDFGSTISSCVCLAPPNLIPFEMVHPAPPTKTEMNDAFGGLVVDMLALKEQCEMALNYEQNTRPTLSIHQRWRLPIVCCKVARRKPLNYADSKLWAYIADRCTVTSASSGAELVEAFAKAHQQQLQDSPCETSTPHPSGHHHHHHHHHGHQHKRQQSARGGKQHSPRPDGTTSPKRVPSSRALTPPRRPSFSTGTVALCSSLERSLSAVADHSIDTTHKSFLPDSSLNSNEEPTANEPHLYAHQMMTTSVPPRKSSEAGLGTDSPQNQLISAAPLSRAPSDVNAQLSRRNSSRGNMLTPRHSHFHSHSSSILPQHARHSVELSQALANQGILQQGGELDMEQLGFKQRTAPKARHLTAAEKANNALMLSRLMATVAAVGQSIRSSFSRSSAKVHVTAANSTATTSTTASTTPTSLSTSLSSGPTVDEEVVTTDIASASVDTNTPVSSAAAVAASIQQQSADQPNGGSRPGDNDASSGNAPPVRVKPLPEQQPPPPTGSSKNRVVRFFESFSSRKNGRL